MLSGAINSTLKCSYDQIFLSLEFLRFSHRIPGKIKNAVYRLAISALVPEIFKFEKCVKYANEGTDDIVHSSRYSIKYIK